jgi:hypothetical protein
VLCFGLKVAGKTLENSQRDSEFSPRPTTVNVTVTPTRAGEAEPDPSDTTTLTGEAATALAVQAKVGTLTASSVEVDGSEAVGADEVTFDVTIVRGKGCEGVVSISKANTFQIVDTAGYVWLLPNTAFYTSRHLSKAALTQVTGKYLKAKSTDSGVAEVTDPCTLDNLLAPLATAGGGSDSSPVYYDVYTARKIVLSGTPATVYVLTGSKPLLFEVDYLGSGGSLQFSGYDFTSTITAPTDGESISGSDYGF